MKRPHAATTQEDNTRHTDSSGQDKPPTFSGLTFEGVHFNVEILSDTAFGHGASGRIYRGNATGPWGEPLVVAVKVFNDLMLNRVQRQLIVREIRTASQVSLRHVRILPFLGTVDVSGQQALVALYMGNGNLLQYVKAHENCDRKKLVIQVASAVKHLHTRVRIVHGDLKCANVLISDSGDALLGDFGLSTAVDQSPFSGTTTTGIRDMHTVRFAAPELLLGYVQVAGISRSKTSATDVYAFGMLVLEAMTALQPWSNETTLAVIQKVCDGQHPPQPVVDGIATINHRWWDVCIRCWRRDPGYRPTMTEVLKDLKDTRNYVAMRRHPYRWRSQTLCGPFACAAWLPSGDTVVFGSVAGALVTWRPFMDANYELVAPHGHPGGVLCVVISPNGHHFCSSGSDGTIRRWDAQSFEPIGQPLTSHEGAVHSIAYSPDGRRIVSCSADGPVHLWDATTGEPLAQTGPGWATKQILCVAFKPDGSSVVAGTATGNIVWLGLDGDVGIDVDVDGMDSNSPVVSVGFFPDGSKFILGRQDGTVRVWDLSSGSSLGLRARCPLHSVTASPSGAHVACSVAVNPSPIWDICAGECVEDDIGYSDKSVLCIAFSPDGRKIIWCDTEGLNSADHLFE